MNVTIELMNASSETSLPSQQDFQQWAEFTLSALNSAGTVLAKETTELSIRLVDEIESSLLNESYRQQKGATNILSFPFSGIKGTGVSLLGDLAICAPLVRQEAAEQNKSVQAHWAHLTVHGILHLNGFDHEEAKTTEQMEAFEISILDSLGYSNPYTQDVNGDG